MKNKLNLGFSLKYLIAFLVLFAMIILIAVFVPAGFIRNHFGDILIVIFIYCFIRIFVRNRLKWLALYIFVFATLVEIGQYFGLVYLLGLGNSQLARIAIGTTFDVWDIVMYFIGCMLVFLWEGNRVKVIYITRTISIAIGAIFILTSFVNPSLNHLHNIPGLVGLCMLAMGVFWPLIIKITANGWKRVLRIIFLSLIVFYVGTFAIMCMAIYINAHNTPDNGHDAVIVLGAGLVRGDQIPTVLRQRLDAALVYLNDNPNSMAVVTGGLGHQATVTEAYAMGNYLIRHGIEPERVIYEEWSTTTQENLYFAKQLLDRHIGEQEYTVLVVTNDFHLPRSLMFARQAGFTAEGKAAPTQRNMMPRYYSREHAALLWHLIFWPWTSSTVQMEIINSI